jgi:hypothetical protein
MYGRKFNWRQTSEAYYQQMLKKIMLIDQLWKTVNLSCIECYFHIHLQNIWILEEILQNRYNARHTSLNLKSLTEGILEVLQKRQNTTLNVQSLQGIKICFQWNTKKSVLFQF